MSKIADKKGEILFGLLLVGVIVGVVWAIGEIRDLEKVKKDTQAVL